ncbi:flagellar hook-basal body complex protein [Vogesella fluminis]|uniref:flagellar hook-basal body complex protein n=1 Tax=Vogesella fluminis TaxID=1069161 RepID=UPI00364238ED
MDRVLYLAMNGAKHVAWQQATTSNNLANVHTNGFKADLASFRALRVIGDGAPTRTYQVDNTVGHDMSQGSLQQTGNESDFALATPGFLRCRRRMATKPIPAMAAISSITKG